MADVDSSELKPCPFCGKELFAKRRKMNPYACCATEGCKGSKLPLLNLDVPEDIEAWNHRTPPLASVDGLEVVATVEIGDEDRETGVCDGLDIIPWDVPFFNGEDLCRLSDAKDIIAALIARIAELELLADDARGKRCPECSAPMVSLSTIDGGQRVCSGCDKVWSWHLKEGQPPLIGNNRMVKKV